MTAKEDIAKLHRNLKFFAILTVFQAILLLLFCTLLAPAGAWDSMSFREVVMSLSFFSIFIVIGFSPFGICSKLVTEVPETRNATASARPSAD